MLSVLAVLIVSGCGGGPGKIHPVSGQVLFKEDRKPLHRATVFLQSTETGELVGTGLTDERGKFTIGSSTGEGVPAGDYRVRVEPEPPDDPASQRLPPRAAMARVVQSRFLDFEKSGLTFTVKPGTNQLDIEVEKPSRQ